MCVRERRQRKIGRERARARESELRERKFIGNSKTRGPYGIPKHGVHGITK
jgi:hypothetical protein